MPTQRPKSVLYIPRLTILLAAVLVSSLIPARASITLDGDLGDWSASDRLDTEPGAGVAGYEVYGRYSSGSYFLAVRTPSPAIGPATTFWLNTDQEASTGYQIFGFAGGAEYNVNFFTDGQPYLYTGADGENFVSGPLGHAYGSGGTVVEVEVPEALIGSPGDIDLLIDVNNAVFLPPDYSLFVYAILTTPPSGIVVDGELSDWTVAERLDSGELPAGYELYGTYQDGNWYLAIRTDGGTVIGPGSTIWLNTDEDPNTGYQIFGLPGIGGAEFNVNVFSDGQPYLYTGAAAENLVTGPLTHALGSGDTVLEIEIPGSLVGNPQTLGILIDLNDTVFLPPDFTLGFQFTVSAPLLVPAVGPVTIGALLLAIGLLMLWPLARLRRRNG